MTSERPFPLEFLKQPSSQKLDYFKEKVIVPQRNLRELLEELLAKILAPTDALVYLVFGVTGVGKTRLKRELENRLLKKLLEDLLVNPGRIAVAGIEAPGSEGGKFSHKDYYIRVLEALEEVLIEYKVDSGLSEGDDRESGRLLGTPNKESRALRRAMEKVFIRRQLKAFMVDEAQHLFEVAGGRQMLNQMNWIKSIANLTSTAHVLFGTYELLNCPAVNGQMGRRSEDFHLARYYIDAKADFAEYERVIKTLQRHLPLLREPELEKHCEYLMTEEAGGREQGAGGKEFIGSPAIWFQAPGFIHGKDRLICTEIAGNEVQNVNTQAPDFRYGVCSPTSELPPAPCLFLTYSLGCVGILKSWWVTSLRIALADDAKMLTLKHLQKGELSPARRKQIQQEAEAGERRQWALLQDDKDSVASRPAKQSDTQSRVNSRRVGERKPQRDPVGVN